MDAVRAPVKPRFVSASTGDALTLEDSVLEAFLHFHTGVIEIAGPVGAGKTFALRHLAAVLPGNLGIEFRERTDPAASLPDYCGTVVEVEFGAEALPGRIARFYLAPWGSDELIEYSLACHPQYCNSVIGRLLACSDRDMLEGCPELCSLVLDRMASDPTLTTVARALLAEIIRLTFADNTNLPSPLQLFDKEHPSIDQNGKPLSTELNRLLRHESVRQLAFAKQCSDQLNAGQRTSMHAFNHSRNTSRRSSLIELTVPLVSSRGVNCIRKSLKMFRDAEIHSVLATLMFRLDQDWRPDIRKRPVLSRASFPRAQWAKVDLRHFELSGADFRNACLDNALLVEADLTVAIMSRASLQQARLRKVRATSADFQDANLSEASGSRGQFAGANFTRVNARAATFERADFSAADLTDAVFQNSVLRNIILDQAILTGTDFSGADLTGASIVMAMLADSILDDAIFEEAVLSESNLEGVRMPDARFAEACLTRTILTGSIMANADFSGARLTGAYLAEIDWPGADLRSAHLVGATFHMGSSRSGLVNSDIACEGSRTGFYSSDFDEHLYRRPEDIRSANLCDCDLRGANLEGVDFCRVDLRGARFDDHHRAQLVDTGAFLD